MKRRITQRELDALQMKTDLRYTCKTPQGRNPSPPKVDAMGFGNFSSYCQDGYRIWGFVEESDRDRFCETFQEAIKE